MDKYSVPGLSARYEKLNQKQDLLVRLNRVIPWETFRPLLNQIHEKVRKSQAVLRKPTDVVVLFKMLVLQQLHNISDEGLKYQVNDRLSFMQFLGFDLMSEVPDATTVWLFRKHLQDAGLIEGLFEQFDGYLNTQGYAAKGGQIVDATLIPVGVQHNSKEENVFGSWIMGMGGKLLRTVGLAQAKVQLGLKNLTYNLMRFTWLETRAVKPDAIAA